MITYPSTGIDMLLF